MHEDDNGFTGTPRAAGTTDAVHVGFGVAGHIEVDDVADALHIEATRRDVSGDHYIQITTFQLFDDALALCCARSPLRAVRGDAAAVQVIGNFDGGHFGFGKIITPSVASPMMRAVASHFG